MSGTGVSDDKGIYPFVPEIIRYYLKQDPILPNVETFRPLEPSHRQHILANIESMVIKAVDASGGYGMLIGPASTAEQREEFAARIRENPKAIHGGPNRRRPAPAPSPSAPRRRAPRRRPRAAPPRRTGC